MRSGVAQTRRPDGGWRGLTDRGNGGDDFTELQLVQNGGLSGGVKTDHQDSHLLATPKSIKQPRESDTHIGGASKPGGTVRLEKRNKRRGGEKGGESENAV